MKDRLKQGTDCQSASVEKTLAVEPELLKVEPLPISDLRPYSRNPKRHSKQQIRQIASSIEANGFIVPIVVDDKNVIIAGHGRYRAAKKLGLKAVPVTRVKHLTEAQVRAYRLADNKIAENATWDADLLTIELNGILDLDVNFDLELTGFDTGEIDIHLGIGDVEGGETVPAPEHDRPATSRAGDVWAIGDHRLICGDALDPDTYISLMDFQQAQMTFTDPEDDAVTVSTFIKSSHKPGSIVAAASAFQKHAKTATPAGQNTAPVFFDINGWVPYQRAIGENPKVLIPSTS